ncbi:hypothetical protein [Maritalea sp.]|uniref:hypothetical protein n=1 Tax=Maritalea sp. TaxID=2003361 RepID=UPI003EFA5B32
MPNLVVLAAFDKNEEGELVAAFDPMQMPSEGSAISKAKKIADDHDGVIAWSRSADPMMGDYGESVELFKSGEVPDLE